MDLEEHESNGEGNIGNKCCCFCCHFRRTVYLSLCVINEKSKLKNRNFWKAFQFYAVFRKPVKLFGRRKVSFDDENGVAFHGMWHAELTFSDDPVPDCNSFGEIQAAVRMAAVAIPLWCAVGERDEDANKCCVLTNWWRERNENGLYVLPNLDFDLCQERTEASANE